jgi:hypothetical protein
MASDRARISYDPTRDYRSVVAQQGRVTLEADVNEAALIAVETLRLETLDIVGPTGTPDDGYKVTPQAGGLSIGAGTMYLGGWRLTEPLPVDIASQPDWLDRPPTQATTATGIVSLLVTEQSVCAVEDQALREVALGGPDSAARMRLMQQFLLTPTNGDTCADGAATITGLLTADGVTWDPKSLQLLSGARLQLGFVPPIAPPDPCTPSAAGGYLGADNQLVRVTIIAFDPKKSAGKLMWGWNNASFLYRMTVTDAPAKVMTLTSVPIDQEHAPRLGHAVEVLRSRTKLGDNNWIAADSGFVTTVAQAYSFDTGTLTLTDALPPEYVNDPNPLFLRLWEAIVPFNAGQDTPLDTTSGLTVNLTATGNIPSAIAARPFWRFAVRPNTPVHVYPARYGEAPQPPDGPRQWLCDLAIVEAIREQFQVLADCRVPFDPLTEQKGGCCGLTLDAAGIDARGGLQAVVDALGPGGTLSLKPGTYVLRKPLLLTSKHDGLTIEGCAEGAILLEPDTANMAEFRFGLIIVENARHIGLRNLDLKIEPVPATVEKQVVTSYTVAGVMSFHSYGLAIESCNFRFNLLPSGSASATAFGGGVVALNRAQGMTIRDCEFLGTEFISSHMICGVVATLQTKDTATTLDDVEISRCLFQRINVAVLGFAHLGMIRCADNKVRNCATGFYFADPGQGGGAAFVREAVGSEHNNQSLAQGLRAAYQADLLAASVRFAEPFFARFETAAVKPAAAAAQKVLRADMTKRGTDTFRALFPAAAPTGAPTSTAPAAAEVAPAAAAAQPAAAAAGTASFNEALGTLETVAVAAELVSFELDPVLHLHDNDVSLVSPGQQLAPGLGIGVLFSLDGATGTVLLNGNRVVVPDARTVAGFLWFPLYAAVNANLFLQPAGTKPIVPAFALVGARTSLFEVVGNVVRTAALIQPPRSSSAVATSWDFMNTEG